MDQFTFSAKIKKLTFILMGVGVLALIYASMNLLGAETEEAAHLASTRLWSNLLINGFFFFAIGLAATFFIALQYASEAAWAVVIKRVFEAVASFMPYGAAALLLVWIAGSLHLHHLYHWMDPELFDPESEHYDFIIAGKQGYLNQPFFWIRTLIYLTGFIGYMHIMRKRSLEEDVVGGTSLHYRNQVYSAIFLVFFGVTSSTASWDWIMSIDTHWFSTLFGWYVFSGMWISGIVAMTLLILYLKSKGHLTMVNENHIHDMGKWMFGISFLWTYLWFSQFMLIYYANIPEEVTYYVGRIDEYTTLYFFMLIINFAFPLLILMSRDTKRKPVYLIVIGIIIFIGHWLDVYMMITPGTMKEHGQIGLIEAGMFLGFLGLFIFVVLNTLSKAPLLVKHHPYLEESLHHQQ